MDVGRRQLLRLTAGKAVANTALRWIPFFLPTLALALDATTATLTAVLGLAEMAGLSTLLVGGRLDRGRERPVMVVALALVAVSGVVALVGTVSYFAVSFVFLILGVSHYTVGGHAYLSRRVPVERRARTLGVFETSWALALLVGAPIVAGLIAVAGWRGPFVAVAVAATVMAVVVATGDHRSPPVTTVDAAVAPRALPARAWVVVAASAAIAMAGLTTIVIAGTWLDEALGVSTGGIGMVAMAFGAAELTASSSSALVADRTGPIASTRMALVAVLAGLAVMVVADRSLVVGVAGLLLFFLGFEYAIVTSFSIVSEAVPSARGRVLAANNAVGTVARGTGTVASGVLYARFGMAGPVGLSMAATLAAIVLLALVGTERSRTLAGPGSVSSRRRRRRQRR